MVPLAEKILQGFLDICSGFDAVLLVLSLNDVSFSFGSGYGFEHFFLFAIKSASYDFYLIIEGRCLSAIYRIFRTGPFPWFSTSKKA